MCTQLSSNRQKSMYIKIKKRITLVVLVYDNKTTTQQEFSSCGVGNLINFVSVHYSNKFTSFVVMGGQMDFKISNIQLHVDIFVKKIL